MVRENKNFEGSVRRAFARLTSEDLPRAAVARGASLALQPAAHRRAAELARGLMAFA